MLTPWQEQWLEHDGKKVRLHGHAHTLKVRSYEAIYPYAHTVLHVSAEPVNKETRYYQDIKRQLGDDWSTDVLRSLETTAAVLDQLGGKVDA